jgi:hypothetical protein
MEDIDEAFSEKTGKMTDFLRDILEESPFLVSNEHLNEAAVNDCIKRLQKHKEEQLRRELAEQIERAETSEQQDAYIRQYQQKMMEIKGSPPAKAEE